MQGKLGCTILHTTASSFTLCHFTKIRVNEIMLAHVFSVHNRGTMLDAGLKEQAAEFHLHADMHCSVISEIR